MKIILSKDVEGLGEEGDISTVADGYARNYLLPRELGVRHNKHNLHLLNQRKASIENRKTQKRKQAMGLKERIEDEELVFKMPAGDSGKLFGSVNNALIAEELGKKGITVDRKRIIVPDHHLRTVGDHTVGIKLYESEETKLKVVVEKE